MKLIKLWISEYKNLVDQTFDFKKGLIALLIGQNGLGKSNLLEIVSAIFKELDLAENISDLNSSSSTITFDFDLIYNCKGSTIRIQRVNSEFKFATFLSDNFQEESELTYSAFRKNKQKLLPDFIIGYYSGENKRIKKLFERHNEIRINDLKKSDKKVSNILGKLFFTDQNLGELLFFSLWVFRHNVVYADKIDDLLENYIGVEKNSKVNISFCNPDFYKSSPKKNADDLQENFSNDVENPFWGIIGALDNFLKILYNNNLKKSIPISYVDDKKRKAEKSEFVFFNDLDYKSLIKDLGEDFDSPVKLFDALQAADSIGIINEIDTTIVKNGAKINHKFSDLSEGEQQLLTVMGLTLIVGEFDTLFLFDEPDTHLNPMWQRNFVKLLNTFNIDNRNSHFLVATHSPLIVQSSENSDVFLFKVVENKVVVDSENHLIHNWRIDQVLVSEYFGFDSARPISLDEYMEIKEKIINKYPFDREDEIKLAEFENEFGVLPTGETKTEIKALQLMNYLIKAQDDKNKKQE